MTLPSRFAPPLLAALMFAGAGQVPPAAAQGVSFAEPSPIPGEDPWTFEITPYGWLLGVNGGIGAFGSPAVDVDMDFNDIWNSLNWGRTPVYLALKGEARNPEA